MWQRLCEPLANSEEVGPRISRSGNSEGADPRDSPELGEGGLTARGEPRMDPD